MIGKAAVRRSFALRQLPAASMKGGGVAQPDRPRQPVASPHRVEHGRAAGLRAGLDWPSLPLPPPAPAVTAALFPLCLACFSIMADYATNQEPGLKPGTGWERVTTGRRPPSPSPHGGKEPPTPAEASHAERRAPHTILRSRQAAVLRR